MESKKKKKLVMNSLGARQELRRRPTREWTWGQGEGEG